MGARKVAKIMPVRYERVRLKGDPPSRSHHAIVFPGVTSTEEFIPKCKLPTLLSFTPTGHGCASSWNVVDHNDVEKILRANFHAEKQRYGPEIALLIPRSLWVWFIPEWLMSMKTKMRLFYLEAHDPLEPVGTPAKKKT